MRNRPAETPNSSRFSTDAWRAPVRASALDLESTLDLAHLARQCQGDEGLQAEVLQLFRSQAGALVAAIGSGAAPETAAAAHKLRGSSLAIGAGKVALSARLVEERALAGAAIAEAAAALRADVDETLAAIGRLLGMTANVGQ